jgi:hypothetical protein
LPAWVAKVQDLTRLHLTGGLDQGLPEVFPWICGILDLFRQQNLDHPARRRRSGLCGEAASRGKQSSRQHLGIIQNQQIARLEEIRKAGKYLICQRASLPVEHQHPAGAAIGRRVLGDQLFGEVEMEIRDKHFL